MFGDSPKELYELLEGKCTPIGARLILYSVAFGAAALGLLALGALVVKTNDNVVLPLTKSLKDLPTLSAPGVGTVAMSFAVTILLLALTAYLTIRWIRGWQRLTMKSLGSYLGRMKRRIDHLEANSADRQSTSDAVTGLMHRVTALEPPSAMPRLREPASPAMEGLNRAALLRQMRQDAAIRSVGSLTPNDDAENGDG